ncbi:hypothetical protein J2Y67_005528 [Neobacillus niacini]|nr:hypothetical protein [Neobacillus niacini]
MGMGMAALFLWVCNFLVGLFFPILLIEIGLSGTFFLFALFAIFGVIFKAKYLPENQRVIIRTNRG